MVNYCMENDIIKLNDIKYFVYSSLKVDNKYFNSFIDECYNKNDGYEKLSINCMIGSLKPSEKQNFKTICIGKDISTIYFHYLARKG